MKFTLKNFKNFLKYLVKKIMIKFAHDLPTTARPFHWGSGFRLPPKTTPPHHQFTIDDVSVSGAG